MTKPRVSPFVLKERNYLRIIFVVEDNIKTNRGRPPAFSKPVLGDRLTLFSFHFISSYARENSVSRTRGCRGRLGLSVARGRQKGGGMFDTTTTQQEADRTSLMWASEGANEP